MHRILVFSDTHGRTQYARTAMDNIREFEAVVHLGDNARDARFLESYMPSARYYTIKGNNDIFAPVPSELVIKEQDIKIFATHGHLYGAKTGLDRLKAVARNKGCAVLLYGHTHTPLCREEDGLLILNPGGYNSFPNPHCGVLEIKNGKVYGCLYEVR